MILFLGLISSMPLAAMHLGVGFSSVTDGRQIPALNIGFALKNKMLLSGMMAGVATKSYYQSTYSLNILWQEKFGKMLLGELSGSLGFGGIYGKKAHLIVRKEDAGTDQEQVDTDYGIGPSFRVALYPFKKVYISLEYVLTIGSGITGNGWGETGIFALGMEL